LYSRKLFIAITFNMVIFCPVIFSQIKLEGVITDNGAEYLGSGAEPVVNALVELTDQSDPSRHFSDYTDSEGKYLIQITETGMDAHTANPDAFRLSQNYPNPFNPSTVISYDLPYPTKIRLDIHNVLGQRVKTLFDGYQSELSGQVGWDATDETGHSVPAGVYVCSLSADGIRINRKMLLVDGGCASTSTVSRTVEPNRVLGRPSSDQYRIRITGTDIETKEQENLLVTNNTTLNFTVSRKVTDNDGNLYKTVKIGNQWWMAENLKVTRYRKGDEISNVIENSAWIGLSTGARCAYDNSESNAAGYGYLYNWYAVIDPRNIAPSGWHVPTDEEWKTLEKYLGMSQSEADATGSRGTNEGGKLKETGTSHWNSPNEGATNESGFSVLPGGYRRCDVGSFFGLGEYADLWSSTQKDSYGAWFRNLFFPDSDVFRYDNDERHGYSVRLIRDN